MGGQDAWPSPGEVQCTSKPSETDESVLYYHPHRPLHRTEYYTAIDERRSQIVTTLGVPDFLRGPLFFRSERTTLSAYEDLEAEAGSWPPNKLFPFLCSASP